MVKTYVEKNSKVAESMVETESNFTFSNFDLSIFQNKKRQKVFSLILAETPKNLWDITLEQTNPSELGFWKR